ncbi:MAG: GAF domain-containing protein, partial [Thermoplasmata archaeon]|nr:GAF domain-containing protein [Thermoplasmata archaeon]
MAKKGKSSASERSRVEKELYKSIFNQFPDIVLIGNASHVIESMNRLAVDAFGDAEGKNCYEILRSVDTPCEDCFFVDGNESSFDFCLTSDRNLDDGSTLEIREMRVSSDPQKWIAVCRKIERFPLKDVSLLELSTAVDMMGDGVSITDLEGRIIYCNSSQERMHGFSKNELIGKKIDIFLPDNLSEGEIRQLFEDIAGGAVERIVMNKHKDGRQFWAWLKTAPMRDKDGRHVGYIGISRDVNEMIGSKLQLQGQVTNLEEKLEKEISHLSKHFDQMKILQELGRRMVSSTSEQEIANHAIAVLSETLGYSAAALVLVTISGHGRSYQILSQSTKFPPSEYGRVVDENIVNKSIDSRSPLIQRYSHESPTLGVIARSELVVPLISRDEVLGALVVADPDESMFTQDDVSLAVTIADLVAISLSNSMSSKQLQNRTMALNVLDEVTLQAISTLDVSGILSETAQRINKILDTQSCMIGMTSSDGQADWMAVEGAGEITEQLKSNKKYNEFFSKIIREGTVFYSNDYSSYQAKLIGENADIKIDSILASPIRLKDQTIGVIVLVNKASPVAFSIQDAELVRNFSDHLAVLIHNAETMASLDYSLRTRNSLLRTTFDLQVASGVSDIYQKVSDMLLEVVPYDAARFYSIREDGIKAVLSRNLGEKVELSLMENYVLDIVIKSLSELRGCQGTNSMTKTSNGEELRASILAIPLIGREDAIGSIVIARAAEKGFSEQDIEIATLFANHAAITLENASLLGKEKDLLAESLGRVKQLESILQLTTSVMSMGTREENPVDNVLSRMSSVLGFSKGLVLNLIEESDELGCSNGIGFEKNEILNLREVRVSINDFTRIIERFGKKFGERIAILGADLPIDPMTDELNLQLLKKIESELAMPSEGEKVFFAMLDTEGDPTGMIILAGGKGEIEKSKDLMGLLEIYGNLASIAINNQRLLDGEIHARSEIEALNDLMTHDINNFTQGVLGYLEMLSLDD